MTTPVPHVEFAFNPAVSAEELPIAVMVDRGTQEDRLESPPLSAEESDRWVEHALFECYNAWAA